MNEIIKRTHPLPLTSHPIEALEEIVRNYRRNEQCIHELVCNTRHERKKAEKFLQQLYQTIQKREKETSTSFNTDFKSNRPKSIEFFVSFDNGKSQMNDYSSHRKTPKNLIQTKSSSKKSILKERDNKSTSSILSDTIRSDHSTVSSNHRVRFNIPDKTNDFLSSHERKQTNTMNDSLSELARRCEDLLSCLQTHRNQASIFEDSKQNESYRPEFTSHTRSSIQHSNPLREEHKHNNEINRKCQQIHPSSHSNRITYDAYQPKLTRLPLTYEEEEIKRTSKKNYEQSSAKVNNRLRENLASIGSFGLQLEEKRMKKRRRRLLKSVAKQSDFVEIFTTIDRDCSGRITYEEFHAAIKTLKLDIRSDDEIKSLFREFDKTHNGQIDLSEFLQQLRPPMSE
ncbi:unnamed protein product [Rotaria magnacalcarata]|uniref:EF-hand domain-containing protein n=4 Tax=Rotaria magnacalcarata TaxID=392030 RepID=A0A816M9I9_9BILA|nr:unnamed protein product [Rotaria magnacalcarata]CAF1650584.1 unnamed protein product [Rotaria magnacalcarata]CAF1966753.1 unnamed protein product [Rotaria magnacalcarata]CAF4142656.1 unnamed protein product [Rotaria magnacalcarata]